MQASSGNLKLSVHVTNLSPTAAVSMSFPAPDLNWFVLQKLLREQPCGCASLANSSEYTALVYSQFIDIRTRLVGTMGATSKTKVSCVKCGYNGGQFIIVATCPSTMSAIRKVASTMTSRLAPHKLYPIYGRCIKLLGGRPDRKEFLHCAHRLAGTMKPSIFVTTKSKLNSEKVRAITEAAAKKLPDLSGIDKGIAPRSEAEEKGDTEFIRIAAKGVAVPILKRFFDVMGIPSAAAGSGVILYLRRMKAIPEKKISAYVTSLTRLKDKLADSLLVTYTTNAELPYNDLTQLASAPLSAKAIGDIIKKHLP